MSGSQVASGILHTSVEPRAGRPLAEARLSDRRRVGVIFQAAALLSHLEAAGWRLGSSWRELRLDDLGVLRGARVGPGRDALAAQQRLIGLVEVLFGVQDRIVGKGQAKRLAADALRRWHRCPTRLPADRIVTQLLDEAEFLWQPQFSAGRRALIAEISCPRHGRLVVAGRPTFESKLLCLSCERGDLEDLVASQEARDLWSDSRWGATLTGSGESRLDRGRRLHFQGRWQQSLDTMADLQQPLARILRADCLWRLGRVGSVGSLLGSVLQEKSTAMGESVAFADVAVALFLHLGQPEQALSLLAQRQLGATRREILKLELLAAEVAARSGDWQTAARSLSSIEDLREDPVWFWRWSRLNFWWAHARRELAQAESLAAQTLTRGRRFVPRYEAAELWQKLASVRLEAGDLRGAEKAARHALRLLETVDDAASGAVARWLADLRIRQGRLQGVEILLCSGSVRSVDPRFAGDLATQDLRVRADLVRGRPSAALEQLASLLERSDRLSPERCQRLQILAARALGWLGRGAEARELLDDVSDDPRGHLEPEELPALWALAGDWSRARESAANDAVGQLWRRALGGNDPSQESWEVLSSLGGYRAARLVFDFQVLIPGRVPRIWLEKAVSTLRAVGAQPFAERLDRTEEGSWKALEAFLNGDSRRSRDLGDLFAGAGYFDIRLEWRHRGSTQVLVPGRGGMQKLRAEKRGGKLVLSAISVGPRVRALFALAVREFEPETDGPGHRRSRVRGILGESVALRDALLRLERLAGADVPVLIQGETGTGKELAARQLHSLSPRSSHPIVTVNCAALSETLLLSDLFGHVRGAFTGADRDRAGVFESAGGGTVLLDEIGDLPLAAQGKLLRVLQEGEVRRVGESLPRQIDIRIVAATHRDLSSMVRERTFRADLFYRLKVGCLTLPPLRNRESDVLLLADHFAERSGHVLTRRARQRLLGHAWPGNVRELRNVLQVAMALSEGTTIDLADLELPDGGTESALGYHQQVEEFRRELVREALTACDGQRSAAARKLAVSRQAMSYLVRRFGLR